MNSEMTGAANAAGVKLVAKVAQTSAAGQSREGTETGIGRKDDCSSCPDPVYKWCPGDRRTDALARFMKEELDAFRFERMLVSPEGITMTTDNEPEEISRPKPGKFKPLRIWLPVVLMVGMVVLHYLPSFIDDGPSMLWMSSAFGPLACGALIFLWWVCASRATWRERLVGFAGMLLAIGLALVLSDPSMRGPAATMLTIPVGTAAFAVGAIVGSRWLAFRRTFLAVGLMLIACGFSTLLRYEGLWGDLTAEYNWRWTPSPEEQMLAGRDNLANSDAGLSALPEESLDRWLANPEWTGFRGADRNGIQTGPRIASNWDVSPPELLWKIAVGPAWSSFSVAGELLFTQEQRGPLETVVCLQAGTGKEIWTRSLESRFDDPLGGPGPRATPTLDGGRLFALGAQGWLMRLDPKSGEVIWQQDLRKVAERDPPVWGFSSSPLVTGSSVVVFAGGSGDKGTLAFDTESGELRWSAAASEHSYSSPQLCVIGGDEVVAMATDGGVDLLDPDTGASRLKHVWPHKGYRSVQPQMIGPDSLLIPTGMGSGTRRIRIATDGEKFSAEELWTSRKLKPDFNDCVVFKGHAYGFDESMFTCIDLETGKRAWKDGRYGKGQVLLLKNSALLLVVSERGEVLLLKADPTKHVELARMQAIKGKTWNHPVVVGDRLYIRNAEEAACYRLPLEDS